MNPSRPCDILPTTIADRRAQFWHPGCSRVRQQTVFRGWYSGSKTPWPAYEPSRLPDVE